jgi:hypothetical protein
MHLKKKANHPNKQTNKLRGPYSSSELYRLRESQPSCKYVKFEVFTAVTMKNGVFWDVTQFGFCKNGRFGGT